MSPELRLHRPGREEGAFLREGTVQTKVPTGGEHPGPLIASLLPQTLTGGAPSEANPFWLLGLIPAEV